MNLNSNEFLKNNKYADSLFKKLGSNDLDILDYSNYENANVVQDLNKPINDKYKEKYSFVYDGGTLEHVFNFPNAIKNCMDLVKAGGYFCQATVANNLCGHGFYQFSPELYYRIFSEENGFGRRIWNSGEYYIGMWKDFKFEGPGKFVYNDGSEDKGMWKNCMFMGK